jgi:hypothetical protein
VSGLTPRSSSFSKNARTASAPSRSTDSPHCFSNRSMHPTYVVRVDSATPRSANSSASLILKAGFTTTSDPPPDVGGA